MDRVIRIEVQPDGTVATLLGDEVMDTDTEWRTQVGNRPVLILARMLAAQVIWAADLGAEAVLPTPEVLAALAGHS